MRRAIALGLCAALLTSAAWAQDMTKLNNPAAANAVAVTSGSLTSGHGAKFDANGFLIDSGAAFPVVTGGTCSNGQAVSAISGTAVPTCTTNMPFVICSVGTQVAMGSNTTETALESCSVAGNSMGANGCLLIDALGDWTNNGDAKTIKVRWNTAGDTSGANAISLIGGANAAGRLVGKICNRNATNSQIGGIGSGTTGATGGALTTSNSLDTTGTTFVVLTGTQVASGDNLAVEEFQITVSPHS